MISLTRIAPPQILLSNHVAWTSAHLAEIASGTKFSHTSVAKNYNKKEVKEALLASSHDKCMYCESHVKHVEHGEIEHIIPKSVDHSKVFAWDNLGFCCPVCNNKKGEYYTATESVINPFAEDPREFVVAVGSMVFSKPGNNRGLATVNKLDLNRVELVEKRAEKIRSLQTLLDQIERLPTVELKDMMKDHVHEILNNKSEYSFVLNGACLQLSGNNA